MLRVLPLLIFALLLAGCSGSRQGELEQVIADAAEQGRQEARADLADGELRLRVYGLRGEPAVAYDEALEQLYGVQTDVVAGCVVYSELLARAKAYNDVMEEAIAARHGPDWVDRARQAAQTDGVSAGN